MKKNLMTISILALALSGCASQVHETVPVPNSIPAAASMGLVGGTMVGMASKMPMPTTLGLGTGFGIAYGMHLNSKQHITEQLTNMGAPAYVLGDSVKVYLPADQVFQPNSDIIRRSAYPMLSLVMQLVQQTPENTNIEVTGYTDNLQPNAMSTNLGDKQAKAISAYFWALGVNNHRLTTVSGGSSNPIADNNRLDGAASNRRIEVAMYNSPPSTWGGRN